MTWRSSLAVASIAAATAVLGLAVAGPAPAQAACAHANDTRATAELGQLERALVCLVNRRRHTGDRPRLDRNRKLDRVAADHSRVMVAEDCFRHRCRGEPGLGRRIRASGYLRGARSWRYAENLGCALTPRVMLDKWLHDRFHRRNLMKGRFRDVGIGAVGGAPSACSKNQALTTFTGVFAWRRP